jgi:radical SAM PhpK family P-methyltransferase
MTHSLIIGHNDGLFADYVHLVRSMGTDSGAWRDLNLAFVHVDGVPLHCMDVLNLCNDRDGPQRKRFSNMDFLWPAVATLTSYLHHRGFNVDYANRFQEDKDRLAARLRSGDVMSVAITTTLYVGVWWIEDVIAFVRRCNPSVRVIVGGPFIHTQSRLLTEERFDELLHQLAADFYVISPEGQHGLAEILDYLTTDRSLETVGNIAYQQDGRLVRTAAVPESNPLPENLVDYSIFRRDDIGEFVTVRTSKSCPFACAFCGFPQRVGKYEYENVAAVERELENIRAIGSVTTLTFIDDTFNVPLPRFKEILRMMVRKRYGFKWNSFIRADHVDEEALQLMRESGCEGVFLGVESGSDEMLKRMNKTSRSAHYRRVIPALKELGILTYCSLIVGFPGETDDTLRETRSLIVDTEPDFYRAQLWYCDPNTPVWARRQELGIQGSAFAWRHPTMDAARAARIIDQWFLEPQASIWLPQQGFELWSVFYLQRLGMPLEQLKAFLRTFNDAVREKLRSATPVDFDGRIVPRLAASGRFDVKSWSVSA